MAGLPFSAGGLRAARPPRASCSRQWSRVKGENWRLRMGEQTKTESPMCRDVLSQHVFRTNAVFSAVRNKQSAPTICYEEASIPFPMLAEWLAVDHGSGSPEPFRQLCWRALPHGQSGIDIGLEVRRKHVYRARKFEGRDEGEPRGHDLPVLLDGHRGFRPPAAAAWRWGGGPGEPQSGTAMTRTATTGRLNPLSCSSSTGSVTMRPSTAALARWLSRISPGPAASLSREARLTTFPIAA
jgi:hypothetical protein